MRTVLDWIGKELRELMPPTLFFLATLHLLVFTRSIALREGISWQAFLGATVAALIIGKAVLIADALPWINRFPEKPLAYNVLWKTAIYLAIGFVLHYLEELFPLVRRYGLAEGNRHLLAEVHWPRFWLIQLWLLVLLLVYTTLRELIRVIGRRRFFDMFFRTPAAAAPPEGA